MMPDTAADPGSSPQRSRLDPRVRTLIVEDEPIARRALRSMLDSVSWIECVGEAVNADDALSAIRVLDPELIFLDVRLPGASAIDVLGRADTDAVVIFATAFNDYALAAFELGAIDYVTKPFGPDRVHRALDRAAVQLQARRERRAVAGEETVRIDARLDAARAKPLEAIYVRDRGIVVPVPVGDIVRLEADGDFVAIHSQMRRHLVYLNLGDVYDQLDPDRFVRVHRSHVVNLAAVSAVRPIDPSRVEVVLRDGSIVPASRAGTRALRHRMRAQHVGPRRSQPPP